MPDPAAGDRWQDDAARLEWPQADIDAITRDKVLIGQKQFMQVFEPYIASSYPVFVTSDSLLNAYHILFEESVRRIESANAVHLMKLLQHLWEPLSKIDADVIGNPTLTNAAKQRAQVTLAVAIFLLGDERPQTDPALAPLVTAEVKKVIEATAVEMPQWLGPPDDNFAALDYSRFKPRGFYTQSEYLSKYFRAVSWLEAIPFRLDRDQELLAAAMIGRSADHVQNQSDASFFDVLDALLGPADQPDLETLSGAGMGVLRLDLKDPKTLAEIRKSVIKSFNNNSATTPSINDQLHPAPDRKPVLTFRVISARRTPDAVLFQQLLQSRRRDLLSGLDVVGSLGSFYARQRFPAHGPWSNELFKPVVHHQRSVYCEYLNCLEALLADPEKGAPDLFASAAWQAKSCQTALAGWAQQRHTWQLQAKENISSWGLTFRPAGFVEPVPEFYSRMASLCGHVRSIVDNAEASGPDFSQLSADAHELIALAKQTPAGPNGKPATRSLSITECRRLAYMQSIADLSNDGIADLASELPALEKLAADFDRGKLPDDPRVNQFISHKDEADLDALWNSLEMVCRRLDALANKQLRRAEFNEDEKSFLKSYGYEIAQCMLYSSGSFVRPHDDAPRIADVLQNPQLKQFLEVGIGRPRALFILYPYHSGEVLCEGAVMPYYEFASQQRLTDSDWKKMLDSQAPPKQFIRIGQ